MKIQTHHYVPTVMVRGARRKGRMIRVTSAARFVIINKH